MDPGLARDDSYLVLLLEDFFSPCWLPRWLLPLPLLPLPPLPRSLEELLRPAPLPDPRLLPPDALPRLGD